MANPDHVALVREGFDAIARWRAAHPRERLDLTRANLKGGNLNMADLTFADLRRAVLGQCELLSADLSGADVNGADFSEAQLGFTSLGYIDLSGAKRLETTRHFGPSTIGTDTLVKSARGAGNRLTPELRRFFGDAGVPRALLEAVERMISEIQHYSCFIAYGQPDLELATKLCQDLEAKGVSSWLYDMDKTVGKRTWGEIGEARRSADKFGVLCSAAALVRDGVLQEIEDQINEDPDRVVPISLDRVWREPGFRIMRGTHDLKPDLVNRNYADFANRTYEEALQELLKGLRRPEVKKTRRSKKSS